MVNIILDPIFIFSLDMGMRGVALATVIGQGSTFVMTVIYFFNTKTFKLHLKSFVPKARATRDIITMGASAFFTQTAIVFVAILCNL